jgi:hypothetical protein
MRAIFAVLAMMSMSFATTCYFATDFGRTICIEQTTPDQHMAKVKIGLQKIIDGELKANLTKIEASTMLSDISSLTGQAPEKQVTSPNVSGATVQPTRVSPSKEAISCKEAAIKDWNAYCVIMQSQGFLIDCQNANKDVKKEILGRLKEGKASYQYRCSN